MVRLALSLVAGQKRFQINLRVCFARLAVEQSLKVLGAKHVGAMAEHQPHRFVDLPNVLGCRQFAGMPASQKPLLFAMEQPLRGEHLKHALPIVVVTEECGDHGLHFRLTQVGSREAGRRGNSVATPLVIKSVQASHANLELMLQLRTMERRCGGPAVPGNAR